MRALLLAAAALLACAPARAAQPSAASGFRMAVPGSAEPAITESDVATFTLEKQGGGNLVVLQLNPQGQAKLARLTGQNLGKTMTISIRGKKVHEPQIAAALTGNRLSFTELTPAHIVDLARVLAAPR